MKLAKAILFVAAALVPMLSGCISIPEEEMEPYVRAIAASGRDKLNLPELPPPEDREWMASSDNDCTFILKDLRNRNFDYYFRFKPESDGTFSLVSEQGNFDSDSGFPHYPKRMVRCDSVRYIYLYDKKQFECIWYCSIVWTPGVCKQTHTKNISLEEALSYIKKWNEITPKIYRRTEK